jgi:AraC-like DNA-binding protein
MDRARQMLASERTVTDVCLEIGYESLGSFSSKFRALHGQSPVEFQRQVRHISDTVPHGKCS